MGKMRSPEIAAQLAKLAAMSDDDIDTDDIPEAPAENWAFARRPGLCRAVITGDPTAPRAMRLTVEDLVVRF